MLEGVVSNSLTPSFFFPSRYLCVQLFLSQWGLTSYIFFAKILYATFSWETFPPKTYFDCDGLQTKFTITNFGVQHDLNCSPSLLPIIKYEDGVNYSPSPPPPNNLKFLSTIYFLNVKYFKQKYMLLYIFPFQKPC